MWLGLGNKYTLVKAQERPRFWLNVNEVNRSALQVTVDFF